jgi:HEAT repeat protein
LQRNLRAAHLAGERSSFHGAMFLAVGVAVANQPWFWAVADAVALTLLFLNVVVLVAVHARRMRQYFRTRRAKQFQARVEEILGELDPATRARDPQWLRTQIGEFDELEQQIAATMLIERTKPASEEERVHTLAVLREAGAVDSIARSTGRGLPWRRALAIRTLGWIGAEETVPLLIERLSDQNRYVRESAVRALGRIGDSRALPSLAELFRAPGRVGPGVVYDALVAFGPEAEPVFAGALGSEIASVRVASCFGVAVLSEPESARRLLEPLLGDGAEPVRSAAAESLGQVAGGRLPDALAQATRDERATVRSAATGALGSYDDPRAVKLAVNALLDPDRDTAVCAGESLVLLSRGPLAGEAARHALGREEAAWPVERALTLSSLGVV